MMHVSVLFFGELLSHTKVAEIIIADIETSDGVNEKIRSMYPGIINCNYRIAVNKKMTSKNTQLHAGDVLAFLPPFAGG